MLGSLNLKLLALKALDPLIVAALVSAYVSVEAAGTADGLSTGIDKLW